MKKKKRNPGVATRTSTRGASTDGNRTSTGGSSPGGASTGGIGSGIGGAGTGGAATGGASTGGAGGGATITITTSGSSGPPITIHGGGVGGTAASGDVASGSGPGASGAGGTGESGDSGTGGPSPRPLSLSNRENPRAQEIDIQKILLFLVAAYVGYLIYKKWKYSNVNTIQYSPNNMFVAGVRG